VFRHHNNPQRKLNDMRTKPTIALMVGLLFFFSGSVWCQESTEQRQLQDSGIDVSGAGSVEQELVQVDWIQELTNGGITMIAIGVLSVFGVALILERLVAVSRKRIVPPEVMHNLNAYLKGGDRTNLYQCCKERTDPLSQTTVFVLENSNEPCEFIRSGASDIASRSIRNHLSRVQLLAAVAGLAPLLGLLGTMIGMIESFKLVSVYGDEGGAAILASSISKALITTAAGLVVAIPTLAAYHLIRTRLLRMAGDLEAAVGSVINHIYKTPDADSSNEGNA
jgi:biopolymer transport protein ExbB/TolQ